MQQNKFCKRHICFLAILLTSMAMNLASAFLRNDPLCFTLGCGLLLLAASPSLLKGRIVLDNFYLLLAVIVGWALIGLSFTGWAPNGGFTRLSNLNFESVKVIDNQNRPSRLFLKSPWLQSHSYPRSYRFDCSIDDSRLAIYMDGVFWLQREDLERLATLFPLGVDGQLLKEPVCRDVYMSLNNDSLSKTLSGDKAQLSTEIITADDRQQLLVEYVVKSINAEINPIQNPLLN